MKVSIIIATYGSDEWAFRARRAADSADAQSPLEAVIVHGEGKTLAQVRNKGAQVAQGDWLCFLDGDDELAPGYLAAMQLAWREVAAQGQERALLVPRVQYVRGGRRDHPRIPQKPPTGSLQDGNWCVIGTLIQKAVFNEVGGFEEWPIYEDWALFARAWKAGAELVEVPDAVYVAHRRTDSRNHSLGRNGKLEAHDAIRRAVFPELYA